MQALTSTTKLNSGLPTGDLMSKPIEQLTRADIERMTAEQRGIVLARCMTAQYLPYIDSLGIREATELDKQRAANKTLQVQERFVRELDIWVDAKNGKIRESINGGQQAAWAPVVKTEEQLERTLREDAHRKIQQYGLLAGTERAPGAGGMMPVFVGKDQIVLHPLEAHGDGRFTARFDVVGKSNPKEVLAGGTMELVMQSTPYDQTSKKVYYTQVEVDIGTLERRSIAFPGTSGVYGERAQREQTALIRAEMIRRGWLV